MSEKISFCHWVNNKKEKIRCVLKVGSNNSHIRKDNDYLWVTSIIGLSSFGFFSGQIVSTIGHVARYAPSSTSNFTSKINPKANKRICEPTLKHSSESSSKGDYADYPQPMNNTPRGLHKTAKKDYKSRFGAIFVNKKNTITEITP